MNTQEETGLPNPEVLLQLVTLRMPFGKYVGAVLADLPEPYLLWFRQQGFPNGSLGRLMALALEIKVNGLEGLLEPLRNQTATPHHYSSG